MWFRLRSSLSCVITATCSHSGNVPLEEIFLIPAEPLKEIILSRLDIFSRGIQIPPADDTCFPPSLAASLCSAAVCTRLLPLCTPLPTYFQSRAQVWCHTRLRRHLVCVEGPELYKISKLKAISLTRRPAAGSASVFHLSFGWFSVSCPR